MPDISHIKFQPSVQKIKRGTSFEKGRYAELQVTTNFSFLAGASHAEEYVNEAALLGYRALAVTDINSLAGVVRAHIAAKEIEFPFIVGCRLELYFEETLSTSNTNAPTLSVLTYPTSRESYANLCRLLTLGKRRTIKGECFLTIHDFLRYSKELVTIVVPPTLQDTTT
ncbi:MAG: PHP domain-containing protein, partial [Bdellovibrionales bacterium]|nr:PHP domain-containing protein [Bdellovibrionales bacterium]